MSGTQTLTVPGYQVLQYLGSGARSTIWQIRQCQTGEMFALKRAVKRQFSDTRFLRQAINEHDVGVNLNHPVIRRIYRMRRIRQWLSLHEVHVFMELCEGQTVQQDRPRSVPEVVRIFAEVAGALAYMNAGGFVHGDIKPNNILVAPASGAVKIIDLGQSCRVGTVKDRIQGTPDFIAPEQVQRQPLDGRTDAYNFGAALYWTLTGQPIPTILPKEGSVTLKVDMTYVPPEELNRAVPPPLSKLVTDCIEVRPAQRPDSMREVAARLGLISHTMSRSGQPAEQPKEPEEA